MLTLCLVFAIIIGTGRSLRGFRDGWSLGGVAYAGELSRGDLALASLHRPVMRVGFKVVLGAGAAEEKEDFLTVFRHWRPQSWSFARSRTPV